MLRDLPNKGLTGDRVFCIIDMGTDVWGDVKDVCHDAGIVRRKRAAFE